MTRHVIAKEGMPSILPDTWLGKRSLWMDPKDRIPVTVNFDWASPPIGVASDLQRNEETGEVSVEVRWFDETFTLDEEMYHSTFWANELVERQIEATDDRPGYRQILSGRVRGVSIVPVANNQKFDSHKTQAP